MQARVDPVLRLQSDPGLQTILESGAAYFKNVLYAAIVNPTGRDHRALGHRRASARPLEPADDLDEAARRAGRGRAAARDLHARRQDASRFS